MKIAILPGDGIGQEIMLEAEKVLDVLRRDGMKIETERAVIGGTAYDQSGDPLPEVTLKLARQADAISFPVPAAVHRPDRPEFQGWSAQTAARPNPPCRRSGR